MEIAVISGKGGTGKSSITAAFASLDKNIVLADCDVDAANLYLIFQPENEREDAFISGDKALIDKDLCTNCGSCVNYCRFDAIHEINGEISIYETACDGCKLCSRICPAGAITMVQEDRSRLYAGNFRNGKMVYGRLAPGEENSGRLVDVVRDTAKDMLKETGFRDIIIDGPPGIGCPVISTITGVDRVVIVTEPTLSGLHDLERTVEVVSRFRIVPYIIINKADLNNEMSDEIENFCQKRNVKVVARIPFEQLFVEAMIDCQSIVEKAPKSEVTKLLSKAFLEIKSNN
ncbi:MAG: ATP-binding protein [Paludibacter sp.]|nr:ATP-binding protein [Paludibacter sp.]